MPFYTFIMQYEGGTYVSQVEGLSTKDACIKWANELEDAEISDFGQSIKKRLIEEVKSEEPVLLNGLTNVWCVSALVRGRLILTTFVQTDREADNEQPATDN